jgi:3-deoxy-manno-octulosonate cytidylyltransferase (CMP-KDO synthetase)
MKATVIIPARYGSTRLAAKPLADLCGKPMIQHVYERAVKASFVESVAVATDDQRIVNAVKSFGGRVVLTAGHHQTGTDRISEVAEKLSARVIVNLQGDLPLLVPEMLDELIDQFLQDSAVMGTLMREITSPEELYNPNVVKVVTDAKGFALYFSRAPIPYVRDVKIAGKHYKHYGVYIYQREFLKTFTQLPPSPLEQMEKLEQLRALEHGYRIKVVQTQHDSIEVDTPEDLEKVREILLKGVNVNRRND